MELCYVVVFVVYLMMVVRWSFETLFAWWLIDIIDVSYPLRVYVMVIVVGDLHWNYIDVLTHLFLEMLLLLSNLMSCVRACITGVQFHVVEPCGVWYLYWWELFLKWYVLLILVHNCIYVTASTSDYLAKVMLHMVVFFLPCFLL